MNKIDVKRHLMLVLDVAYDILNELDVACGTLNYKEYYDGLQRVSVGYFNTVEFDTSGESPVYIVKAPIENKVEEFRFSSHEETAKKLCQLYFVNEVDLASQKLKYRKERWGKAA